MSYPLLIWLDTLQSLGYKLYKTIEESDYSYKLQKFHNSINYIEIFSKNEKIQEILIMRSSKFYPESQKITVTQFTLENQKHFRNSLIKNIIKNKLK